MSEYYHINPAIPEIIAGPFSLSPGQTSYPTYIKKLCCCGNPGNMTANMLLMHGLVPLVSAQLSANQKYGDLVVYADRVERGAVDLTAEELLAILESNRSSKISEVEAESDRRVAILFSPRKAARALAKAAMLNRKAVKGGTLTQAEEDLATLLESVGVATELIRLAEDSIILELEAMTLAQITTLSQDWITTHASWPAEGNGHIMWSLPG